MTEKKTVFFFLPVGLFRLTSPANPRSYKLLLNKTKNSCTKLQHPTYKVEVTRQQPKKLYSYIKRNGPSRTPHLLGYVKLKSQHRVDALAFVNELTVTNTSTWLLHMQQRYRYQKLRRQPLSKG